MTKVCEHCLIGMRIYSLYGRVQVYECELDKHYKDCLAGFFDPCENGYSGCFNEKRVLRSYSHGRHKVWDYDRTFQYNLIPYDQMRKSEDCIEQEKEEHEKKKREADELRQKAFEMIKKADEVEHG